MTDDRLTVVFMPESAYGPTNNCIGIGDILRRRGHRIVFAAEASWEGDLEPLGFEEHLVELAPPSDQPQETGEFWKEYIREAAPEFKKPTIDQLETVTADIWKELIDGARYCEDRLKGILDHVDPDVVVEDNVLAFPALMTCGAPFVRIVSCNPLEVKDPQLPPPYSGYPVGDDSRWEEFRREYDRTHRELWEDFNEWVVEQGAPPLEDLEFIHESDHLNMYLYPEIADYERSRPLDGTWHRLDSSVRRTDEPFEVPEQLREGEGSLIYLSLGSLGSADVSLMSRLVSILADTPYRYIVSKGPQHEEYDLADNMWGEEFLPQVNIIPEVDLVITHGGNNTVTESFHFGKPMITLPLFWDQYDNAQRVDEKGFGVRLDTYHFDDHELPDAIDELLANQEMRETLEKESARIQQHSGVEKAANLIEQVAKSATTR